MLFLQALVFGHSLWLHVSLPLALLQCWPIASLEQNLLVVLGRFDSS